MEEVIMDVVMTNLYPRVYKRDTSKPGIIRKKTSFNVRWLGVF